MKLIQTNGVVSAVAVEVVASEVDVVATTRVLLLLSRQTTADSPLVVISGSLPKRRNLSSDKRFD